MLKLAPKDSYKRTVKVDVPLDLGKVERQQFVVKFKRLSATETRELVEEFQADKGVSDEDLMRRYLLDWEGVSDEDGNDIPYTSTNLDAMMDVVYIRKAIVNAFVEEVFGKEATRKN